MSEISKSELLGRIKALERQNKAYEDRIAFLEKTVQDHAHSISSDTVLAIAAFVKQDIVKRLSPPEPQASEQPHQEQEQVG